MDGKLTCGDLILLLFTHSLCLCPVSSGRSQPIQHTQKDITTPITTIPTIIPTVPIPIVNPTSIPSFEPTPAGSSWCVASQSASQSALQIGLDYACGVGGADCAAIQYGGSCFEPDSVRGHASFAFNSYYQNNPIPNSCNFGGTAVITSTNPSTGTCQYPSTSTSSSVLNTTNSSGATVFGAVPAGPSTSPATKSRRRSQSFVIFTTLLICIASLL